MWFPANESSDSTDAAGNDTTDTNSSSSANETFGLDFSNETSNATSQFNGTQPGDTSSNNDTILPSISTTLQRRFFYVYYTTADETTYSSDVLVDGAGFISSVGGNLGLFLGFSFFGILFPLYEKAERIYRNSLNKK